MTREADVGTRRLSQSSSSSKPVERPASGRLSDSRLAGSSKEASHVAFAADSKGKGKAAPHDAIDEDDEEDEAMHCAICLSVIDDRTVCDPCQHDAYCFMCILAWTDTSRRCPLCTQTIRLLIHNIRSDKDFQRHYLAALPEKDDEPPRSIQSIREGARRQLYDRHTHPRFRYADWKARNKPLQLPELDAEDLALQKRKYIYRHKLFVKHVASNRFTRYRDHTAHAVQASAELKQRLTKFVRRELRVFDGVDQEFLTGYIVSIASQLELRSDSAVRLLAEFLDEDDAEHFLHETYSFLRSPFKDIRLYDSAVQYDRPERKLPSATFDDSAGVPPPIPRSKRPKIVASASSDEDEHARGQRPQRQDAHRRNSESTSRRAHDTYIPPYSIARIAQSRPAGSVEDKPPREARAIAREARANDVRETSVKPHETINALVYDGREHSVMVEDQQPRVSVPPDSDVEDLISLGGDSDAEHRHSLLRRTESAPAKLSLSILGASRRRAITPVAETPVMRSDGFAKPSSSTMTPDRRRILEARLSHAKARISSSAVAGSQSGHRGAVDSDLRAKLMAKLEEAKQSVSVASSKQETTADGEQKEQSLRQSVLAALAARRNSTQMPKPSAAEMNGLAPDSAVPSSVSKSKTELLKERMQKEKKLAQLRSKLTSEKAALADS